MGSTMNISLPDHLRAFVERAAAEGGYGSVSEYLRELVSRAKAERELELELSEASDSPDLGEFEPGYFENLRRRLTKRQGAV